MWNFGKSRCHLRMALRSHLGSPSMRRQAALHPPHQVAHEFASGPNRCLDRQRRQHTKGLTYIATFAEDVAADMTQQME